MLIKVRWGEGQFKKNFVMEIFFENNFLFVGVFVITGVKTCRDGYGYCILGTDCTVDKEFINDDLEGHCDGLKKAFTPRAFFVCCQSLENCELVRIFYRNKFICNF